MSPKNLSHTCLQYVQGLSLDDNFEHLKCKYPLMAEISIDLNSAQIIAKPKTRQSCEIKRIKPIVLKELRHEISPIIWLLFERSLSTGVLQSDWIKAVVSPFSKRETKVTQLTIGHYHSPVYFARL